MQTVRVLWGQTNFYSSTIDANQSQAALIGVAKSRAFRTQFLLWIRFWTFISSFYLYMVYYVTVSTSLDVREARNFVINSSPWRQFSRMKLKLPLGIIRWVNSFDLFIMLYWYVNRRRFYYFAVILCNCSANSVLNSCLKVTKR